VSPRKDFRLEWEPDSPLHRAWLDFSCDSLEHSFWDLAQNLPASELDRTYQATKAAYQACGGNEWFRVTSTDVDVVECLTARE
jgi:hypothetical protein